MTLADLALALEPIADATLGPQTDPNVAKIGIVLAAIMGAIEPDGTAPDQEVIDALAVNAGLICQHRAGRHPS